jgi:hypothetical protein
MVKTRYRPKNPAAAIVKPAPQPQAAPAASLLLPVKQEKGAAAAAGGEASSKPFVVPGSEEEALTAAAAGGGSSRGGADGKRGARPEGRTGLSATGLTPSQELLSQTTRRDRDVLARLQRVMQQQQREGAGGGGKGKKRGRGGGEAAARQKCCMCYETVAVYVSPCGHLGCLRCWKGWLGRFPEGTGKCFVKCGPVTLRQLKRVVVQDAGATGNGKGEGGGGGKKKQEQQSAATAAATKGASSALASAAAAASS